MAAPSTTARTTPDGAMLPNGYQALVAFDADPDFNLWEKEVTPPSLDGGDPVDTQTQHDVQFSTQRPRALTKIDGGQFTAGYDPLVLVDSGAMLNLEQSITWHFPDGSSIAYWGYLKAIKPTGMTDGNMPLCTAEIVITNWDPYNCVIAGPSYTAGTGSC